MCVWERERESEWERWTVTFTPPTHAAVPSGKCAGVSASARYTRASGGGQSEWRLHFGLRTRTQSARDAELALGAPTATLCARVCVLASAHVCVSHCSRARLIAARLLLLSLFRSLLTSTSKLLLQKKQLNTLNLTLSLNKSSKTSPSPSTIPLPLSTQVDTDTRMCTYMHLLLRLNLPAFSKFAMLASRLFWLRGRAGCDAALMTPCLRRRFQWWFCCWWWWWWWYSLHNICSNTLASASSISSLLL